MAFQDLVAHARAHSRTNDPLRKQLARGQQPAAMLITCSDSRIVPAAIVGSRPGEVFELRTAGNVVPSESAVAGPTSELATIEFAVTMLGVRDIILCGHSHCGAVAALTGGVDTTRVPAMARWLAATARPHVETVAGADEKRAAERRHLLAQFATLAAIPVVARRLDEGELRLHCWFYDIGTGAVSEWTGGDLSSFREL